MKKLLIVVLAVFFVAGLVDTGFAEDRLKIGGSYRMRPIGKENYADFNDAGDDDLTYFDNRFRTQFDIAIAEGISARLRTDFSDGTWGLNYTANRGGQRPNRGTSNAIDIDRAYARWETEMFNLIVGLDALSLGAAPIAVDQQTPGIKLRIKLPLQIDLIYQKIDENGSQNDSGPNGDEDFFAAQGDYKGENWNINVFGAGIVDNGTASDEPIVIGLSGHYTAGAFVFTGEFDTFFGDVGATDIMGNQLWVDAKYNFLPNANIGIEGFFAEGTNDATEVQYTALSDWGSYTPTDRMTSMYTALGPLYGIANVTGGTSSLTPIFDPSGNSAGVVGFQLYGEWRFLEQWNAMAGIAYLTPQEDSATALDSVTTFSAGIVYDWMTNTTLRVGYNFVDPDVDGVDTDSAQAIVSMIQVTW